MPARPDTGRRVRTWVNRILMLAILAWLVPAWAQQTRIVDRIEVDESGGKTRIRLDFNVPLQYINHAPQDHGDKLILQLRPVVAAQTEDIDFTQPESLTWESGPGVPLQFVRYEGGTAQRVQLGIYFVREIDYEVQPGTDARSLSILLARPETPPAPLLPRAPEPGPAADTRTRRSFSAWRANATGRSRMPRPPTRNTWRAIPKAPVRSGCGSAWPAC